MKKLFVGIFFLLLTFNCIEAFAPGTPYTATAYCLRGRTASGIRVARGIVAADPRLHPLGTYVHISAGAYSGKYLVADTGGKIKGRRFDIWVASKAEARKFGRRKVFVRPVA